MYALGMTTNEIKDQIYELFECNLSGDIITDITDKIMPEILEWQKRRLEKVYPIIFIDATHFSVRSNSSVVKKVINKYCLLRFVKMNQLKYGLIY